MMKRGRGSGGASSFPSTSNRGGSRSFSTGLIVFITMIVTINFCWMSGVFQKQQEPPVPISLLAEKEAVDQQVVGLTNQLEALTAEKRQLKTEKDQLVHDKATLKEEKARSLDELEKLRAAAAAGGKEAADQQAPISSSPITPHYFQDYGTEGQGVGTIKKLNFDKMQIAEPKEEPVNRMVVYQSPKQMSNGNKKLVSR